MYFPSSSLVLALLSSLPLAYSWGSLGHRTVSFLSTHYFNSNATAYTTILLNGQDISEASLWPDKVRKMPAFSFSAGWHYIDAHDDPPHECGVKINRDCSPKAGCIVSAIANQTARIRNKETSRVDKGQALRFLLHFFGDIHQPLHTEAEGRGGNDIPVKFSGRQTNLHAIWDTDILRKHVDRGDSEIATAKAWAKKLYENDKNATVSLQGECRDLDRGTDCSLDYADEVNQWVCDYVLKDDVEGVKDKELSGEYYDGAVPIVEELLSKAGRRLGAWINALADEALEAGWESREGISQSENLNTQQEL